MVVIVSGVKTITLKNIGVSNVSLEEQENKIRPI